MEISLNLMGFTDFFHKEMLTKLISFSLRNTFSLNLFLKPTVVQAENYELLHFFFSWPTLSVQRHLTNLRIKVHHRNLFSQHVTKAPFNADFAIAKVSLVMIIKSSGSGNSSSCSRSGGGSDITSSSGSSSIIWTSTSKYKLGVILELG